MMDQTVENIIKGKTKLKNTINIKDLTPKQLTLLQEEFATRKYLSVAECAVWLGLSCKTIYRYIDNKLISAYKWNGETSSYIIDVARTKKILGL